MNIAVLGLWHLGSVTAACTAATGHTVVGWDPDAAAVSGLAEAHPLVSEPGLPELREAVADADIVWVAFDTPVDDEDRADVELVVNHVTAAFPHLKDGAMVLSSSQLPVGSVARLERAWAAVSGTRRVTFACSPENLRLGKAIEAFTKPDRAIVGVRDDGDRPRLLALFAPFTDRIEWMSVESAEMTKHAINAFLATSVTFINEIAGLCEQLGADAKDVERGLKSEKRIGPHAYLGPGAAFAGGTLARDVVFLQALGQAVGRPTPLLDGVGSSNREHRHWARRRIESLLESLEGRTVAVWGLTYKPGTDTLRRSTAVELCRWLLQQGARVRVHDPVVKALPDDLSGVTRTFTPEEAAAGADALVVGTEWPAYRQVNLDQLATTMTGRVVVDANRFLAATVGADERFSMVSVGVGSRSFTGET